MKRVERYKIRQKMKRRWYAIIIAFLIVFLMGFLTVDYNTSLMVKGHGELKAFSVNIKRGYIDMNLLGSDIKIPMVYGRNK